MTRDILVTLSRPPPLECHVSNSINTFVVLHDKIAKASKQKQEQQDNFMGE